MKATANPNAGQNYALTIKRAFRSLQECKEPILTQKDAMKLKFVGPAMAKKICPQSTGVEVSKASSKPNKSKATPRNKSTIQDGTSGSNDLGISGRTLRGPISGPRPVCPYPSLPSNSRCTSATSNEPPIMPPTTKEKAYAFAKAQAESLVLPPVGPWKVILLVDNREHKSKQVVSSCKQAGIPCEERQLAIGDMAWIARCVIANDSDESVLAASTGASKKRKKTSQADKFRTIEIMVGTIVERKEVSDLVSSLFGTRYAEQRLRLSQCGIPQVLFLVEGNLASASNCPAESLQMAMMETRINLGFQIIQTKNLMDTVSILKTLHARIVQRTFPEAFGKTSARGAPQQQALPSFGGGNKRRGGRGNRRASSLLELVFDTAPVPPFGSKRFITYPELKAKVEVDRERGTRSVRAISLAMMKQIPTLSQKKCTSIANHYPTLNRLISALSYPEASQQPASSKKKHHPKKFVQDIEIDSGRRTIGPVSASEIYAACCTLEDGSTVVCHEEDKKQAAANASQRRLSSYLLKPGSIGGEEDDSKKPALAVSTTNKNPPAKKGRTNESITSAIAKSVDAPFLEERPTAFSKRKRPAFSSTCDKNEFASREAFRGAIESETSIDICSPPQNKQCKMQQETVDLLTPESTAKPKAKLLFAKKKAGMDLSDGSDSIGNENSRLIAKNVAKSTDSVLATSDGETTVLLSPDQCDTPSLAANATKACAAKGAASKTPVGRAATLTSRDGFLFSSEDEDSPFPSNISRTRVLANHNAKQGRQMSHLKPNSYATSSNASGKRLSVDSSLGESSFLFSSPNETNTSKSPHNNHSSVSKPAKENEIVCLLDDSDDDTNGDTKENVAYNSGNYFGSSSVGKSNAFVTTTRGGALHSTQESAYGNDSNDNSSEDDLEFGTSLRKQLGTIRGQDLKEVIELDSDSE